MVGYSIIEVERVTGYLHHLESEAINQYTQALQALDHTHPKTLEALKNLPIVRSHLFYFR